MTWLQLGTLFTRKWLRLVCKVALVTSCSHLVQVLPASVPQLGEADATASEYSPLAAALRLQRQLADDWFERLTPEATGSAMRDALDWALSVSMPRLQEIVASRLDSRAHRPELHMLTALAQDCCGCMNWWQMVQDSQAARHQNLYNGVAA